jgi:hypothetical protein
MIAPWAAGTGWGRKVVVVTKFIAAFLVAILAVGCGAQLPQISQLPAAEIKALEIEAVEIEFVPDAQIWWGRAGREVWAKDRASLRSLPKPPSAGGEAPDSPAVYEVLMKSQHV